MTVPSPTEAPLYYVSKISKEGRFQLDLTERVISFEYTDSERKIDKLRLTVDNFDLANFDDPAWRTGVHLEVAWGYHGNLCPARIVVIQKITGFQKLTIEARGKAIFAGEVKRSRVWENHTRAEVVQSIAEGIGFVDPDRRFIEFVDVRYETISQAHLSDAQMLTRLAAKEGFVWYVDVDGFHWHRRNFVQRPTKVYTWYNIPSGERGEILSISIENDVTKLPVRVKVCGNDPNKKKPNCVDADEESDPAQQSLAELYITVNQDGPVSTAIGDEVKIVPRPEDPTDVFVDPGGLIFVDSQPVASYQPSGEELYSDLPIPDPISSDPNDVPSDVDPSREMRVVLTTEESPQGARREANKKLREAQEVAVKLKMKVIGNPLIHAKIVIELRNIGKRLSQRYYVREVVTRIGSDYTLNLDCVSDGHGGHNTKSIVAKGFSLLEPRRKKKGKKDPTPPLTVTEVEEAALQSLPKPEELVARIISTGEIVIDTLGEGGPAILQSYDPLDFASAPQTAPDIMSNMPVVEDTHVVDPSTVSSSYSGGPPEVNSSVDPGESFSSS